MTVRLAAVYFAYFVYVGAAGPYLSLYLAALGRTSVQIGALLAAMQFARIFAPSLWAHDAEINRRPVRSLRLTLALGTLILALLPLTESLWLMGLVLCLQALCAGGAMPLLEGLTIARLSERPAQYGRVRLWGSVGFVCAVTAVGAQLDLYGIGSLIATLVGALFVALLAAGTLDDRDLAPPAGHSPWHAVLARTEVRRVLIACFLMNVAHGPFYAFFSIHLIGLGFSKTAVGLLWSLGVLAEISAFWLQPRWAGRWTMERVFAFSLACAVLRFAAIALIGANLPGLLLVQLLHGATFGTWHVSALALLQRDCPEPLRGRAQALYMGVSFGAGGMVGSLLAGALWDRHGALTFMAGALFALAGLMVFWRRSRL